MGPSKRGTHVQREVAGTIGRLGSQLAQLSLSCLLGGEGLLQAAAQDAHGALVGLVLALHLLLSAAQVRAQPCHPLLLFGDGPGACRRG